MQDEFIQKPEAKLVDDGNGDSVLLLTEWNVEDISSGYTRNEVESLIKILQESLDIMNRYYRANQKLPLFEESVAECSTKITTDIPKNGSMN